jgi:exodeoxyribonuclease VII large subunit
MFPASAWSVSAITGYLRALLESDLELKDIWIQGEISNISRPSSGHLYFTLKDSGASLRCVMWRNSVQRQAALPRDGDALEVHGYISIYDAGGQYQLYADMLRPLGEGFLYQEFLRLKTRLEAEGLFDPARKRKIPTAPQQIGVVTSPSGAALRDILNTLRRRYPLAIVTLAPTAVQGEEAPQGIVAALQALNRCVKPDVILLARGGGSIEDLWAFNDERVARAIAASASPVITGVGHETDYTIADFIADLRAPTPTAAAELATPDQQELRTNLNEMVVRLNRSSQAILSQKDLVLRNLHNRLILYSPRARLQSEQQQLDDLIRQMNAGFDHQLKLANAQLNGLHQRLLSLNPLAVLKRGYALITDASGKIVQSIHQVAPGDPLALRVSDGSIQARVEKLNT